MQQGPNLPADSIPTSLRMRCMSSFFRSSRCFLFFFSIHRLSSRLERHSEKRYNPRPCVRHGDVKPSRASLAANALFGVHGVLLVEVVEHAPRVKVVPKVVKLGHLLIRSIIVAKRWDRLDFGEAGGEQATQESDRCINQKAATTAFEDWRGTYWAFLSNTGPKVK